MFLIDKYLTFSFQNSFATFLNYGIYKHGDRVFIPPREIGWSTTTELILTIQDHMGDRKRAIAFD